CRETKCSSMPQAFAKESVGFSEILLSSSSPRIMPIVLKTDSLPAAATAAIWFENAPPKVSNVVWFFSCAAIILYLSFLNLFPETKGCNKSSRLIDKKYFLNPNAERSILSSKESLLFSWMGIKQKYKKEYYNCL